MKATGIVRRIDELGRIVVPKEIRRTMRIRVNDPLEIFTDRDGEIILKKYSPISEIGRIAKECADALYLSLGHTACICDKDMIVETAGGPKKELKEKMISGEVEQTLMGRQPVLLGHGEGRPCMPIIMGEQSDSYTCQIIAPIICEGEAIGGVLMFSRDAGAQMGRAELKSAETAARFVGRQLEG